MSNFPLQRGSSRTKELLSQKMKIFEHFYAVIRRVQRGNWDAGDLGRNLASWNCGYMARRSTEAREPVLVNTFLYPNDAKGRKFPAYRANPPRRFYAAVRGRVSSIGQCFGNRF